MNSPKKKVALATLGCKLNFAETSAIAQKFFEEGYERVAFESKADVYVINTCSVTQAADKKCRQLIHKATRYKPGAIVAVVGCYAQLKAPEIAHMKGVDLVLGTREKFDIVRYISQFTKTGSTIIQTCAIEQVKEFVPSFSLTDRTRAFLKVQDGCDYTCSYCTIPLARGKSRNESSETIVQQAIEIAQKGIKEIVLTGVNIGDFGRSTGESFIDLLKKLDTIDAGIRFRISSIEPNLLTDEIIDFISLSKHFVPHFHIPLQSGCNEILARMRRRYRRELFANRVNAILKKMPSACIGADVISGFPGETDRHFQTTLAFLSSLDLSYLHAFTFSERNNTPAAEMEYKVPYQEKERRTRELITLSETKRTLFYQRQLGSARKVLFEAAKKNGLMFGFSDNYVRIEHPYDPSLVNREAEFLLERIAPSGNVTGKLI